jgi:hypothetical protein
MVEHSERAGEWKAHFKFEGVLKGVGLTFVITVVAKLYGCLRKTILANEDGLNRKVSERMLNISSVGTESRASSDGSRTM